jgi:hypothetical protein
MSTKNNATTVSATATAIANILWQQVEATYDMAALIVKLHEACGRDVDKAGKALGLEWHKIGAQAGADRPVRLILESCLNIDWTDTQARSFIRAAGFVRPNNVAAEKGDGMIAKQRLAVLGSAVYGGVSTMEAKGEKGKDKKDKAVNPRLTGAQIVKAIESATLTNAEAEAIVRAVQAKLA